MKAYTLERGAKGTGLSEEQILELVELIHSGKAGILLVDHGRQSGL